MRKGRASAGGYLFMFGIVALVLYGTIYNAIEGHPPSDLPFFLWWLIGISIAWEIYIDLHEAIDQSTTEIKEEIERAMEAILKEIRRG